MGRVALSGACLETGNYQPVQQLRNGRDLIATWGGLPVGLLSPLFDRGAAARAFEVSQVDEMLTWMERYPLPFVCTTNLIKRVDTAVPRRFTLKLRFEAQLHDPATIAPDPRLSRLASGARGRFAWPKRHGFLSGS